MIVLTDAGQYGKPGGESRFPLTLKPTQTPHKQIAASVRLDGRGELERGCGGWGGGWIINSLLASGGA